MRHLDYRKRHFRCHCLGSVGPSKCQGWGGNEATSVNKVKDSRSGELLTPSLPTPCLNDLSKLYILERWSCKHKL